MKNTKIVLSLIGLFLFVLSCNKSNEILEDENVVIESQFKTSEEFDPLQHIEDLKDEYRNELDNFNNEGFELKFDPTDEENFIPGEIKDLELINTTVDYYTHPCLPESYPSFAEAMKDCETCTKYYTCPDQWYIHAMAFKVHKVLYQKFLNKNGGQDMPSWVKQQIWQTYWEVAYAIAMYQVVGKYCFEACYSN